MTNQKSRQPFILFMFIIIIAAWRVLTYFFEHSNTLFSLTPVFAMALFASAYLKGFIQPLIISLSALFISDVILCFTVYASFRQGLLYHGWYWVYGSFLLIILAGKIILMKISIKNIITAVLLSSFIHWIVATASECMTSQSPEPFITRYLSNLLPAAGYELKILAGTLFYSVLLFGGYEWIKNKLARPKVTS